MQEQHYTYHVDPAGCWLEVPMQELIDMRMAGSISPQSFRDGDTAYLEEDFDIGFFCHAKAAWGVAVVLDDVSTDEPSFIRDLSHYTAPAV